MELLIVGINHQTAPVSLREKVAFTPDQLGHALQDLLSRMDLAELAILSTCNRTELICIAVQQNTTPIVEWLAQYHHLPLPELQQSIYVKTGTEGITHMMRVASGLDSMVLGEPQILGQVKDSFTHAQLHKTIGPELYKLSQATYQVAKRVRTETAIGENSVSVASTAVTLASQLFADLSACNALLIGAGETIKLVARHLVNAGINDLVIANRTVENAQILAEEHDAQAIDLSGVPLHLVNADIVITSTASQLPILGKGSVESALKKRRHKPIFMVDLAVPRDIEPEVSDLRDVYLYTVDDLQQIIDQNLTHRADEAARAENIITEAVQEFVDDYKSLQALDTLVRFRKKNNEFKEAELDKALRRLQRGEDPAELLRSLANQLTNKLIHAPSIQLKQAGKDDRHDLLLAIEDMFQLGED
ncbi:MAG: glutamyl-tRNA reductase [Proteobacteria bacterium]|nr:glutamyl-tRNA reductase [Pseudomonadota bacterium]